MRRRPFGIWAVVILQICLAITLLPGFAETFTGISPIGGWSLDDVTRGVFIAWAVLSVLSALWLWTLSRRGWAMTMILIGVGLIGNLALWWLGQPHFVRMAIQAATALYLNSAPVRQLFERRREVETIVLRESADT
jgi:hypothetical protein